MADMRGQILQALSRQQRGIRVRAGDRFIRGRLLVNVTAADTGRIAWDTPTTGESDSGTRTEFAARALTRLAPPPPQPGLSDLLTTIWDIAGARGIDPRERHTLIVQLFPAVASGTAGTDEEKPILRRWLIALMANLEPERSQ